MVPPPIDAVPMRHPWRWVSAVVIVALVGLFIYGAATNEDGWSTYFDYLFNERILLGVLNTLQLTVYAMVLGVVLGIALSVMRLSPNPVFRWVAWVFLWVFRGTPASTSNWCSGAGSRRSTSEHPARGALRSVAAPHQPAEPVDPVPARGDRSRPTEGLHGRKTHPRRNHIRAGGAREASTALGMSWV